MPQVTENISSVDGTGNAVPQVRSPCHSVSSAIPVTNGLLSAGLTNSPCSEYPLSESSGGVVVRPQISGNVDDFQNFLDEPSNWEWAVNALSVEPGHSDRNIFVSKLPPTFKDVDLQEMFQNFGRVVSAKVMLNVKTGTSKETGFVQFTSYKDALRARAFFRLRLASLPTTPGMPAVVTQWAQNKHDGGLYGERCQQVHKLFIRNVPSSITQADMKAFVSRFGTVSVVSVHNDTYDSLPAFPTEQEQCLKFSSPSEGTEGEEAVRSSPEPSKHETIICFVTFVEDGAAMRACCQIHNTTPFDSCNGVPLMAKLAEDNSARHARRYHSAAAAYAAPASRGTCTDGWHGCSAYSSAAPTPLACAGGYHCRDGHSQVSASQHPLQKCNAASNYARQPSSTPVLSAGCLGTDLSRLYGSQSATPPSSPQSAECTSFNILAPRRAFRQRSVAMSTTATVPPETVITPPSPSLLFSTMSPSTQQEAHATRPRRVLLPPALSVEATTSDAMRMTISTTTPLASNPPHYAAAGFTHTSICSVVDSPMQARHHRQSTASASSMGNYRSISYTPVHTPHVEEQPQELYEQQQCQQQALLMGYDAGNDTYHPGDDFYQEYYYSGEIGPMESNLHPLSPSASSELLYQYGNAAGSVECNAYRTGNGHCSVAPLWQRRMERQRATAAYADPMATSAGLPHLLPCVAYGDQQPYAGADGSPSVGACMQAESWETNPSPRAKSAVAFPHALYPQAMVLNSGSQATTPSNGGSGSVRYRNNPYSMRVVQTIAQYSSPCVES
ncbi:RNA binding protein, putative [Leishmania panamensis]|uniref:RNA binding protein, putative n=1 Tax=Leishmania panamensis TaxID=5679 RepID=A0A088RVQ3_LEIPA|nr:RNA binding protein, putative [Leishmania panamensis]AIO00094.1 RNA binding protein, putative [Leishmania panamensis]